MTEHLEPAPDDFVFDGNRVEAFAVRVFADADPDLLREIEAGRISWSGEHLEGHAPRLSMIDKRTGRVLGTLDVPWHEVCRIDGK